MKNVMYYVYNLFLSRENVAGNHSGPLARASPRADGAPATLYLERQ